MATATTDSWQLAKPGPQRPITRKTTPELRSVTRSAAAICSRQATTPVRHRPSRRKGLVHWRCCIDPDHARGRCSPSPGVSPRHSGGDEAPLLHHGGHPPWTHEEGLPSAPTNLPKSLWLPTAMSARSSGTTPTRPRPAIGSASSGRRAHTTSPSRSATTPLCRRLLVTATAEPAGPPGNPEHPEQPKEPR